MAHSSDSDSSDEEVMDASFEAPRSYKKVTGMKLVKELGSDQLQADPKLQLWLFKVPKELDLKKIDELPVSSMGKRETFSVGSKSYYVGEDLTSINDNNENEQKYALLRPAADSFFTPEKHFKISRFFNVSESVTIPEIDWDKVTTDKPRVKPVEGLRMRHFPTGYYIKDFKEASEPVIPEKKRKASAVVEPVVEEQPKKKAKKSESKHHHKHKEKKKKHHHSHA